MSFSPLGACLVFDTKQYELLDFGEGRKLERFGMFLLDRPCPVAELDKKTHPARWPDVDARYERGEDELGTWQCTREMPDCWHIDHGRVSLELKRTPFGHVGLFPEQADNWDWITRAVEAARRPLKVLNLFAYTGGSTLAAAAAGAEVVHVDAAKNVVDWARRNAQRSGLAEAPIRWIDEDAMRFVQRELKRGNEYDAVILDPPSYGRGPKGQVFTLHKHLPKLLQRCARLTYSEPAFMLLTHHSTDVTRERTLDWIGDAFGEIGENHLDHGRLEIGTADGRRLPSGQFARWRGLNL